MRWGLPAIAWLGFVIVFAAAAYLTLSACDLGYRPLYGYIYCKAQARPDPLAAEREREQVLRDKVHQAELRLARLPVCTAPRAEEQRERIAQTERLPPAPPLSEPEKKPEPRPEPQPAEDQTQQELVIPQKLSDLKGCWQSIRGDIQMYSDDEEHRPIGKVRICYCFDAKGAGTVYYVYQNGGRCRTRLKSTLTSDRLSFSYGRIPCTRGRGHVVPADVRCRADVAGAAASCDTENHGRFPSTTTGEKYRRVGDNYCQ